MWDTTNDYYKLMLLKVDLEATESWSLHNCWHILGEWNTDTVQDGTRWYSPKVVFS